MTQSDDEMERLQIRATQLVRDVMQEYEDNNGCGSLSCTVYDTAWVSMVSKIVDDKFIWLFPPCFQYILESQQSDGSWIAYGSHFDGVLNTAAALLALCQHRSNPYQLRDLLPSDIDDRILRAETALRRILGTWEVEKTLHVGYEMLVPALLDMLGEVSFTFEFPGRQQLLYIHEQKMCRFDPKLLYGQQQVPALHSLEAFVGKVDFDRLRHHTRFGSMLASPSSTAAYLIHSTDWDSVSEAYLERVIADGEGKGRGGVPSAFPSTNFEIIWIISTLLRGGYTPEELDSELLDVACNVLESSLKSGMGLLGFAPQLVADADDTARGIMILRLLGRPASLQPLVDEFYAHSHFNTYPYERNPSFTVNCNVLAALLTAGPQIEGFAPQIRTAARFLCETWWDINGMMVDKWNLSTHYPAMLLAESVMLLLQAWDQGQLSKQESDSDLIHRLMIMSLQILVQTLRTQDLDGSWAGGKAEPTSYAILTLISLTSLPVAVALKPQIQDSVDKGRAFLANLLDTTEPDYLWIEKVTYRSKKLHEAYILAALHAPTLPQTFEGRVGEIVLLPLNKIAKIEKLAQRLPLFASFPAWMLKASLIEGFLFLPLLLDVRLKVFPRKDMAKDKYFEYIPFAWTATNNLGGTHLPNTFLYEMMVISFLNFQVDEYMETTVSSCFAGRLQDARQLINHLFDDETKQIVAPGKVSNDSAQEDRQEWSHDEGRTAKKRKLGLDVTTAASDGQVAVQDNDVAGTLRRFRDHVLDNTHVQTASSNDRTWLRHELRMFLLAHVEQTEDNHRLFESEGFRRPHRTFFDWVRRTGSDHTSCPYSFAFAVCLLGREGDFFLTSKEKYLAQATCHHLAIMCRMYNDLGSVARDRQEKNLNSLDFCEFHGSSDIRSDHELKDELYQLAAYERQCVGMTMTELRAVSSEPKAQFVQAFINVTDLFGQIYVEKDIASRMK